MGSCVSRPSSETAKGLSGPDSVSPYLVVSLDMQFLRCALPLTLLLGACSTPQGKPLHKRAPEINSFRYTGQDRIAPGDILSVRFLAQENYDQEVLVQADGRASFREIDEFTVAGMLPGQLDEQLTQAYSEVISGTADLTVVIATQAPRQAYVFGEVLVPGPVLLGPDQELTFLEALALAGGPIKETSWLGNALFVRWDAESQTQRSWILDARTRWWGAPDTIVMQPNDVIFIPNTRIDRVAIELDNWVRRLIPFPRILTQ